MDLVVRAVVIFFVIWIVTRAVGRRELSSMEPFDLILLVVIGDLVQQGVTQSDYSLTGAIVVIVTIAVLTVAMSFLSFRVPRLRPVLEGEPLVLVQDGQVIDRNLRRERITLEELRSEARQNQIDDLAEIRFAVLETNGRISFIGRT
ncbi:unannotated protein [freshwater metagenome]|uniref:Unannotated protein n=1 Tax=freshwater metagenome TaxID=449393 RepID=A0A6J7I466_9ZZZZ|nr:DUF421 domain-containing protein [Actinomycetota bacterium]